MSETLLTYFRDQCSRYLNGECRSHQCLMRGGWKPGEKPDPSRASCQEHEVISEILRLRAEVERLTRDLALLGPVCIPFNSSMEAVACAICGEELAVSRMERDPRDDVIDSLRVALVTAREKALEEAAMCLPGFENSRDDLAQIISDMQDRIRALKDKTP